MISENSDQQKAGVNTEHISVYLWFVFILCMAGNNSGGVVSTLMAVYLPVVLRDLGVAAYGMGNDCAGSVISTLFLAGWTAGGFICGIAGDWLGRSKSFSLSLLIFGTAVIMTGQTSYWPVVIISRFISGFGAGGMLVLYSHYLLQT
jgi:MFS family permease